MTQPHNYVCLVGRRFGKWTVLDDSERRRRKVFCRVKCDCGTEHVVGAGDLRSGKSASCGCATGKPKERHGWARTPTYQNWERMIQRCENANCRDYEWYGALGITVCERWRNSFAAFLEDMGERPADGRKTVERIDNSRGYEPGNCRWASQTEQTRNQRHPGGDLSKRSRDPATGRLLPTD